MPGYSLDYFGHCAFRWRTPDGTSIAVDPFDNDETRPWLRWFADPMPFAPASYLLITHDHFDHRAAHRVPGAVIVPDSRDLALGGLTVSGVMDQHVPGHGPPAMRNLIYMVDAGGVRCCHWGDNRLDLPRRSIEQLGRIDVLMLPVDDSCHLLDYGDVASVIDALNPRVVIPMHYFHDRVSAAESPLRGIDEWLKSHPNVRRVVESPVELDPRALPNDRQVWVV